MSRETHSINVKAKSWNLKSFRCFLFSVTCAQAAVVSSGNKSSASPYRRHEGDDCMLCQGFPIRQLLFLPLLILKIAMCAQSAPLLWPAAFLASMLSLRIVTMRK